MTEIYRGLARARVPSHSRSRFLALAYRDVAPTPVVVAEAPFGEISLYAEGVGIRFAVANGSAHDVAPPVVGVYRSMRPWAELRTIAFLTPNGVETQVIGDPVFQDPVVVGPAEWKHEIDGISYYNFYASGLKSDSRYFLRVSTKQSDSARLFGALLPSEPHDMYSDFAWRIQTLRRDITVTPGNLTVELDGDPTGPGEMKFDFWVYDAVTGDALGFKDGQTTGQRTLSDREVVPTPFAPVSASGVNAGVIVGVNATEIDGAVELPDSFSLDLRGEGFIVAGGLIGSDVGASSTFYRCEEFDDHVESQVMMRISLLQSAGRLEQNYELFSGDGAIRHRLPFRIVSEIQPHTQPPKLILRSFPFTSNEEKEILWSKRLYPKDGEGEALWP